MVPQINTAEEAARAVYFAYYAPKGQRGVSPYWAITAGEDFNHVVRTANDETVLVLQVESVEAYENLDEIKKVEGIDVLFAGPLDLSASVGRISDTQSSEVQDIMRDIPKRLEGTNIIAGTTLTDVDDMQEKIDWGYRYINIGNPMAYGVQVVEDYMDRLRKS